ncbi:hypothetical protein JTB14_033400 [Gonioctena quinquepunctata]|nr:hypothetical protein JTB14_033400 [Gonioctena quinquepunctata]
MENANLVCPLCRLRIGSWLRKAKKESKLVNQVLWKAIQKRFPEQIENKRRGVDENLEEKHEIRVSHPGEIRKEYELQKRKDDAELERRRETELKASEELIKKLKDEEDHRIAVMEEKLKLDEQVARKLASEMSFSTPSFSKSKIIYRKYGPMDKFIKKDNETITSQNAESEKKSANNFATKEYTCRVLRLDKDDSGDDRTKVFSPIIKKKNQQIQKIVDTGTASDSSDCIESEMRYFKPIDHRLNPPTQGKAPIQIFPKKPIRNVAAKILSPSGSINFSPNVDSAFVRISLILPQTTLITQPSSPEGTFNSNDVSSFKRIRAEDSIVNTNEKKPKLEGPELDREEKSQVISYNISTIAKRQLFGNKVFNNIQKEDSPIPVFYGFDNCTGKNTSIVTNNIRQNGTVCEKEDETMKMLLQEKADLEFAKKLQEELNRSVHNTRSSRKSSGKSKRQTTLDEMIKSPYRVK